MDSEQKERFDFIDTYFHETLGDISKGFIECFSLGRYTPGYDNYYSKLILDSKRFDLSKTFLPKMLDLIKKAQHLNFLKNFDLIIAIPSSKPGEYSKTIEVLAKKVSYALNIPNENILFRKSGGKLSGTKEERFDKIWGDIGITRSLKGEKNILVLDDVITSGATVCEVTKVLTAEGAENVYCISLGRTKRPGFRYDG